MADGRKTDPPASLTFASLVSRDLVRIALLVAALNDLTVLACDIQGAYLNANCRERIYTIAGPEFGSEQGSVMIVKKALYGLKTSGAAFRSMMAATLHEMHYMPTKADPDVWLRPAVAPDGAEYYEMVLCYTDDILSVSKEPKKTMIELQRTFKLKGDKMERPETYLGAQLDTMVIDGVECWTMSAEKYVKSAVDNVETTLAKSGNRLPSKCHTPFSSNYKPELDTTAELKADGVQYYQELVGILRWAVEIGRVDILLETSLMSFHLALPRIGHLKQLYHMFGYLKIYPKRKLAFDPTHPKIDERIFVELDWTDFYRDAKEDIPSDMVIKSS